MSSEEMGSTERLLEEIESQYDDLNTRFPFPFVDNISSKPLEGELLERFIEMRLEGGHVVDMGCGTGRTVKALVERGVDVIGLDLSGKAIDLARKIMPEISFMKGNLLSTPFPQQSVGGVVSLFSLIHLDRALWGRAIGEFFRVLIPGAPLLLSCYGGEGKHVFNQEGGSPLNICTTLFAEKELSDLLRGAGFKLIEKRARHNFPGEHSGVRIFHLAQKPKN